MKTHKIISFILCLSILVSALTGCAASEPSNSSNPSGTSEPSEPSEPPAEKASDSDLLQKLEKAYVYTLPLMIMDATNTKMTNTVEATTLQAPQNQFIHAHGLANAKAKDVVTPNVDTVYSQLFLDLSDDAVVMELPKTDRFCMAEVLDAYTNCISLINTDTFQAPVEKYIFTGRDFTGTVPDNMIEIKCPTDLAWVIIRTICYDSADMENIQAIQEKMDSYTLSQLNSGNTADKPKGSFWEEDNFIPTEYVLGMSMEDYFTKANQLMEANPPSEADRTFLEELSEIHVGAGLEFDSSVFGETADQDWKNLVSGIMDICTKESEKFMVNNGVWNYFGSPIAEFGTEYYYRALIALAALGANPVSVAIYPKASVDSDGDRLDGNNNYTIHFDKDSIPKVKENGFWSVTAYNSSDNLLIDNELDRYCINDRSDLTYNEDGSLDLYIQNQNPGEGRDTNWLPVSDEEFHLYLRIYFPEDDVVQGGQKMPVITK